MLKIRTKLVVSNIFMVFIPIFSGVIILLFAGLYIDKRYIYTWNEFFQDENAVVSAQSTIYAYQKELWNTDWKSLEDLQEDYENDGTQEENLELSDIDLKKNGLEQSGRLTRLGNSLTKMGYHFAVFMNGDCQYSNMSSEDNDVLNKNMPKSMADSDRLVIGKNNSSILKCSFKKSGVKCEIIAINVGNQTKGLTVVERLKKVMVKMALGILTMILLSIILANLGLSSWISKSILDPILRLDSGIKEIKEGNFENSVFGLKEPKNSKNEIDQVCRGFDEMRSYLQKSAIERVMNEECRKELISGISHDLRTPLTTIEGYVEGILCGVADKKEMQEKYLNAILTRSKDLERLLEKLSFYNRLEYGQHTFDIQKQSLHRIFMEYQKKYDLEIEEKRLNINMQFSSDDICVDVDKKEFQRVFDNVVSNSIRYSCNETCNIQINIEKKENGVQICFEDDGPGVKSEELEKIFNSFYRSDVSRTNFVQGSGLGLAIVLDIVSGHGGKVEAYIPKNKIGLGIKIILPRERKKI